MKKSGRLTAPETNLQSYIYYIFEQLLVNTLDE